MVWVFSLKLNMKRILFIVYVSTFSNFFLSCNAILAVFIVTLSLSSDSINYERGKRIAYKNPFIHLCNHMSLNIMYILCSDAFTHFIAIQNIRGIAHVSILILSIVD